jgi:hypothetical protein
VLDQNDVQWKRSSRCDTGSCVEVAFDGDSVMLRQSASPDGLILSFTRAEWLAFIAGVKNDEFRPA